MESRRQSTLGSSIWWSGLRGDDLILGLGGNDTLIGNQGDDRIRGGAGSDLIRGGSGDDTISNGIDGKRNRVYCGSGKDFASRDEFDYFAPDCELVGVAVP